MTDRYSDTAGSNTSPYETWAKAATDPQTIVDLAVAGDFNYYRGLKTLTAAIDFDTNAGDSTDGYVKHIGCAADGSVDGTKYVLDGNTAAANCIVCAMATHWIENFEIKNATSHGVSVPVSAVGWVYLNTLIHNNGGEGVELGAGTTDTAFILCDIYNNTSHGLSTVYNNTRIIFTTIHDNSGYGMSGGNYCEEVLIYGSIIHNNTTYGIHDLDTSCMIINSIIDGEGRGVWLGNSRLLLLGNRITNNTYGLELNNYLGLAGWNYFHNNITNDAIEGIAMHNIPYRAVLTNHRFDEGIDGTNKVDIDADDGYNDRTNDDFNLKASRELNRLAIDLEFGS